MSLATSLAYDVSVMAGPIVWNPDLDAESKLEVLAAANGLIMVAAAIRVATGGNLEDGKSWQTCLVTFDILSAC